MRAIFSSLLTLVLAASAAVAQPAKIPILLDFDIGDDIDDTFALATVLASPELDLRGVTTVGEDSYKRAQIACRFLEAVGVKAPVAAGLPNKTTKPLPYWQVQYGNHASVYFRDPKPVREKVKVVKDGKTKEQLAPVAAHDFLYRQLKANPGELTIVAVGPLSNIAALLEKYPDAMPMIKRIVLMGGSVKRGYQDGSAPQAEYNIAADIKAAQAVFKSGVPLVVAPLDATAMLKLDAGRQKKLFDAGSILTLSVQALVQLWQDKDVPILYDPVAVTLAHTEKFCTMTDMRLEVDDKGFTRIGKNDKQNDKPNARVATGIQKDAFLDWLVARLAGAYPKSLPSGRIVNPAKMVARGGMPNRVHACEDFETDIEKRWWLSGRLEEKNVPPGSKRACRATLTQDFDDRQGETKTLYSAVVFNPVPGPPMGKKPRLSFRYYLKGTDVLRVQIYSLTNGYHRCLTLKGLEQGKWLEGNINMQDARKPDGTGGPLSENERIDDIQFYADPRAELLIDDIVLYDAAIEGETQPFPKRFLFTGWFDSGKQGKEWPGSFEIDQKKGYFWHAAKSAPHPDNKELAWIKVGLRGARPIREAPLLAFRYKLEGAESMRICLDKDDLQHCFRIRAKKDRKEGEWCATTISLADFPAFAKDATVRDVRFIVPNTARLWIDDLLLFEGHKK
jgi:inosine-uridine nucleoside N-ribohydrolase